ncbi:MAG: class I SAM-dependent methyltransferase [Peptococcaceae bacterium]|jgi:ubiquinone/menaquinone biosynthesis C-methylase UbiE|nr:class I SAM-dependent methyltransferase [Peptococcaceae bacterium]
MDTKEIFEQMAPRYDTADRIKTAKIIAGAIRSELTDTREKSAMDYGCGTGLIGLELIDLFKSILFVDASARMIEQVERKIEKARVSTAQTLCGDFCAEPPQVRADYILMAQTLLHAGSYSLLLHRLYGALNQGGRLLIVDFDKNESVKSDIVHNGFVQAELTQELRQMGFASAGARTFFHGKNIFMNQDASLFILTAVK